MAEFYASMQQCLDVLLDHSSTLPPALLSTEIANFGHPTILHQWAHMLSAESSWVCGLQSLPRERIDPATLHTIEDVRAARQKVRAATAACLDSLTEERLNAPLDRYPANWIGPHRPPAYILLHVITHAFHHKGQMAAMLRLLGYPAPDTDMQRA